MQVGCDGENNRRQQFKKNRSFDDENSPNTAKSKAEKQMLNSVKDQEIESALKFCWGFDRMKRNVGQSSNRVMSGLGGSCSRCTSMHFFQYTNKFPSIKVISQSNLVDVPKTFLDGSKVGKLNIQKNFF